MGRRRRPVRQEGATGSVPEVGSNIGTIDEEGDGFSEGLVLKERIKRRGVWSDTWRKSSFGSPLKEGIFAWVKGIGSKFRILYLRNWSLEEKAGKEPVREKDFGVKDLPGAGVPSWTCKRRRGSRAGVRRVRSSREPLARWSSQGLARGQRVRSY